MQSSLYPYHTSQILDASYPYEALDASYPYKAAARSKRSIRKIITGGLLGVLPLLVMLAFAALIEFSNLFMNDAYSKVLTNAAIYGFEFTSPIVLLIAVACLFLKRRRWIALALPVWVATVPSAFILALMLNL